ncbi:MAG: hypothetical protein ABL908_14360 [Hyphomicrobium sp.]
MRHTFSYALLTEIAKVLLLMVLLLSAEYARQDDGNRAHPRASSAIEQMN